MGPFGNASATSRGVKVDEGVRRSRRRDWSNQHEVDHILPAHVRRKAVRDLRMVARPMVDASPVKSVSEKVGETCRIL